MKVTIVNCLLLSLATQTAAVFYPQKISYENLLDEGVGDTLIKSALFKALSETGIVSITGIPNMDTSTKDVLSVLYDCATESKATQEHIFPDGARRLTLATHAVSGAEMTKINHQIIDNESKACDSFDKASKSFRAAVATVTRVFSNRVSSYLGEDEQEPFLLSTLDNKKAYKTFSDVVEFGEHLEHFHSYEKLLEQDLQDEDAEETIEMHADQGLFIAFTPGRLVHHQDPSKKAEITSGFFIELPDGSVDQVEFSDKDDLIFMLGDGVNQYINDKLPSNKKLRAVPHKLIMESHTDSSSRVWFGRMVLPPANAIHPSHGITFDELRDQMISASLNNQEDETIGIGCSGGMVARDLSATTCEDDATYCWHRCMNHTDFEVSHEICASRNLQVQCINPRQEIWQGEKHGDFFPACADNATQPAESPFPTLDEYPRSEEDCTEAEFELFANVSGFNFSVTLPGGKNKFMWNIEDDKVHGRLAYDGLFGWIAFGFSDPSGSKNGMHGSNTLMALPGGNYTGFSGLDLDMPSNVNEYEIDPIMSPFRYWMAPLNAPVSANESTSEIESNECFTAMSFNQASIGNYTFNVSGSDDLIWAANGENAFVQYHGNETRARFYIDWKTGTLTPWTAATEGEDGHDGHDHGNETDHHGNETAHGDAETQSTTSNAVAVHSFGFIVVAMVSLMSFEFLF